MMICHNKFCKHSENVEINTLNALLSTCSQASNLFFPSFYIILLIVIFLCLFSADFLVSFYNSSWNVQRQFVIDLMAMNWRKIKILLSMFRKERQTRQRTRRRKKAKRLTKPAPSRATNCVSIEILNTLVLHTHISVDRPDFKYNYRFLCVSFC